MSKNGIHKEIPVYEGVVLWFREDLGYGYIQCKAFNNSIFVHFKRIVSNETFKTLSKGQMVLFEVAESERGLMAVNVKEKKIVPAKASLISNNQSIIKENMNYGNTEIQ